VTGCCEYGAEIWVSIKAGNVLSSRATISFSWRTMLHDISWLRSFKCASGHVMYVRTICNMPYKLLPPIQLVPEALSQKVKPRREVDSSPVSFCEFKNDWIYSSIPPYAFTLINLAFYLADIFSVACHSHPRQVPILRFSERCAWGFSSMVYDVASLSKWFPTFRMTIISSSLRVWSSEKNFSWKYFEMSATD
jgi:hypothetical protein